MIRYPCKHPVLSSFNLLTSVIIVEVNPIANNMMVKIFSDHKCTAFGFPFLNL